MDPISYPYRPSRWAAIFGPIFSGAMAWILYQKARTNDSGLIVNRVFDLTPQEATWFFAGLALLSAAAVLYGVFNLRAAFDNTQVLLLDDDGMLAPKTIFHREPSRIAYKDISDIHIRKVISTQIAEVVHQTGKFTIVGAMLPDRAAFDEVVIRLVDRIAHDQH